MRTPINTQSNPEAVTAARERSVRHRAAPGVAHMSALPVRIGTDTLPRPMTVKQAQRYGDKHMPDDLRRAGFRTTVFKATPEIHGGTWLRINYGK